VLLGGVVYTFQTIHAILHKVPIQFGILPQIMYYMNVANELHRPTKVRQ
jgi:hypothetical protein